MEMGEAGRFTATARATASKHRGFHNLEGHRFMSADDGYLYVRIKRKGADSLAHFAHVEWHPLRSARSRFCPFRIHQIP